MRCRAFRWVRVWVMGRQLAVRCLAAGCGAERRSHCAATAQRARQSNDWRAWAGRLAGCRGSRLTGFEQVWWRRRPSRGRRTGTRRRSSPRSSTWATGSTQRSPSPCGRRRASRHHRNIHDTTESYTTPPSHARHHRVIHDTTESYTTPPSHTRHHRAIHWVLFIRINSQHPRGRLEALAPPPYSGV